MKTFTHFRMKYSKPYSDKVHEMIHTIPMNQVIGPKSMHCELLMKVSLDTAFFVLREYDVNRKPKAVEPHVLIGVELIEYEPNKSTKTQEEYRPGRTTLVQNILKSTERSKGKTPKEGTVSGRSVRGRGRGLTLQFGTKDQAIKEAKKVLGRPVRGRG